MKLVNEIIEILGSENFDLENALIKAKILAHQLGEKEMLQWINGELVGYPNGVPIPEYRTAVVLLYGNISNGRFRYTSYRLDPSGIPENIRNKILNQTFNAGIKVIHGWILKENKLQVPMPPALVPYLKERLDSSYGIESVWGVVGEGSFTQILSEVRSRLLEFMLELSDRLPAEPALEDIKKLSKEMNLGEVFHGAVFGPNTVLNLAVGTGNTATQTTTQNVSMNNFSDLAEELKRYNIPEKDIQELGEAIEADKAAVEHEKKDFGPKVGGWIVKTIGKAVSGTIDLSVKVATGVVVAAISKYYGFK